MQYPLQQGTILHNKQLIRYSWMTLNYSQLICLPLILETFMHVMIRKARSWQIRCKTKVKIMVWNWPSPICMSHAFLKFFDESSFTFYNVSLRGPPSVQYLLWINRMLSAHTWVQSAIFKRAKVRFRIGFSTAAHIFNLSN